MALKDRQGWAREGIIQGSGTRGHGGVCVCVCIQVYTCVHTCRGLEFCEAHRLIEQDLSPGPCARPCGGSDGKIHAAVHLPRAGRAWSAPYLREAPGPRGWRNPLSQLGGASKTPGGVSATLGRGVGRGKRAGLGTKQMKMVVPLVC